MKILRRYQLDIIFLFFAFGVILRVALLTLQGLGIDPHRVEWYVAAPLIALYGAYLWEIRNRISISDRRQLTGKSLIYWITLGIIVSVNYAEPLAVNEYWSMDLLLLLFTLFLADSYWDFKKLRLRNLFKSELRSTEL